MEAFSRAVPSRLRSDSERLIFVSLFPVAAALVYYFFFFPSALLLSVFFPLITAIFSLFLWLGVNSGGAEKLLLQKKKAKEAVAKGACVGIVLGLTNLFVILKLSPWLGYSPDFLRETPHAAFPFWVMFPFGILLIGFMVETIFRGWILGRLFVMTRGIRGGEALSILLSALFFSFDPFMVIYFKGYHWLALMDGLVWGGLLLKTGNLFSTITAHTIEVWILYFILKVFYA